MSNVSSDKWSDIHNKQTDKSATIRADKFLDQTSAYFFIFDFSTDNVLFINEAFIKITGHHTSLFNLDFLIEIIHEEDRKYFYEREAHSLSFLNGLKEKEHFRFTQRYSFRIRKSDGQYIRIAQESQVLEVNENGFLSKTLVLHQVVAEKDFCGQTDYRIFDKLNNVYVDLHNDFNLTNREQEILSLIKEGMTSKQISAKLFVSTNTVLTHRKNILYKTNSNSFIELVKKMSCAEY